MTSGSTFTFLRLAALTTVVGLAGCKGTGSAAVNADITFEEFDKWGEGLESIGGGGGGGSGGGDDTAGGDDGGGSADFDGTWQGTYTFTANLTDFGYSCTCSAGLTLGIVEGTLQVGQGESCAMDCGINTRLTFAGSVGGSGAGAGSVEEATSFYFSTAWTGAFDGASGTGSWSDTVSTDQGTAEISGSFSVAPL
jgi:hypothetical protein